MKIELEVPDWAAGKHLRVFAGMEMVAVRPLDKEWLIVQQKCTQCGKCCQDVGDDWIFGTLGGACVHFEPTKEGGVCGLKGHRPFACCCDPYKGGPEYCQVKLSKQK